MANQIKSMQEIEKMIEVEASYLMYIDRLDEDDAFKKAKKFIYEKHKADISRLNENAE